MSHSIDMLSIQIDTMTTSNCLSLQVIWNGVDRCYRVISYFRVSSFSGNFNLKELYLRFLEMLKSVLLSRRPFYVNNWLKRELKQLNRGRFFLDIHEILWRWQNYFEQQQQKYFKRKFFTFRQLSFCGEEENIERFQCYLVTFFSEEEKNSSFNGIGISFFHASFILCMVNEYLSF